MLGWLFQFFNKRKKEGFVRMLGDLQTLLQGVDDLSYVCRASFSKKEATKTFIELWQMVGLVFRGD